MRTPAKSLLNITFAAICIGLIAGCGVPEKNPAESPAGVVSQEMTLDTVPDNDYIMPEAQATGELVEQNAKVVLDWSNTADGYIMIRYLGDNLKVKVKIYGPTGSDYTYNLSLDGEFDVFPLSDGSGIYNVGVYENVSGNSYSTAFYYCMEAALKDEFAPFLRPNKYVDFTPDSLAATTAAQITANSESALEEINTIYEYTISNISYDYELAENVQSGYVPDVDAVLEGGKGICFDYAALMTAMLRSVGIPTKLVVGYTGDLYHAWINTYTEESGWVEASIYFDGSQWKLMDPTFAANAGSNQEILEYIGNDANYTSKYLY
ncbi:MAG: transglutaminase domain-containing protein [Clostridia bacterium]|nr:transglutaminase domain-containing protein [Clostridia bacterium]